MKFTFDKHTNKLLLLLLVVDIFFIIIHIFYSFGFTSDWRLSIAEDFSYGEVYQYIKELWIIVLLLLLCKTRNSSVFSSWVLLFIYLLLDDSLRVHEEIGRVMVRSFDFQPMFQLRAQDFGELAVTVLFGGILFSIIGVSYYFSSEWSRHVSIRLFILVMMLALFGVVVDMIAIATGAEFWSVLEDGGEMIIMSIIVCYCFGLREPSQSTTS